MVNAPDAVQPQRDVATRQKIHSAVGGQRRFLPTQLAIETVRACNAKCIMCPSETMERAKGVMEPGVHSTILEKVKDWGAPIELITHAGLGEPLLDKRLAEKIRAEKAAFPNARVVVYSNGNLLTTERARALIDSGLDALSLSINGFRKETYEEVMKLPYEETIERVNSFIDLKRKLGADIEVHVSIVKTNICSGEEIEEFKTYWTGRADSVVTPIWISWGDFLDNQPSEPEEQFPCSYIWKTMMIDFDGTVKMCCEDYDTRFPTGSLLSQDPDEIFNSQRMQAQRSAQLSGDFCSPEICKNCTETHGTAKQFWNAPGLVDADVSETQNLATLIEHLPNEVYKPLLGQVLAQGLKQNRFDFPDGVWPPPTPARAYIRSFLQGHVTAIRGRVVEFDPPVYKDWLTALPAVTEYHVWNVAPGDGVTVVGDLQSAPHLRDGCFDTILCTHVLSAIHDVHAAARELHRLLAPGGVLLCTVPSILQKYAPHPSDYWRFTQDSLGQLLSAFRDVQMYVYGNAATVAGSPFFLMVDDFPPDILDQHDPSCPSILAAAAWR